MSHSVSFTTIALTGWLATAAAYGIPQNHEGCKGDAGDVHAQHPDQRKIRKHIHDAGCGHAKAAMRRYLRERGQTPPPDQNLTNFDTETDVLHYTLDIEVDLDNEWIGGSNLMNVRVLEDGIDTFQVRISDAFNIPALTINGNPVTGTRLDNATIEVTLDQTYNTNDLFDLYIEYNGYPYGDGFGSIVFTTHNGHPAAWTLSETWFAYTWWPAKDVNTDKATADFYFTVTDENIVASQGLLQSVVDVGGGKLKYHWMTNYQTVTYLYSFAITNYNTFSDTFDYDGYSMPVDFFIYPESDNSSNRDLLYKLDDMLTVFSDLYGLYPFIDEKYGIAQFGWGGGMEHQTMTSQSSFSEWLSAHELGHQWWGDMITCATWHDIWLNEGFASYSEAIWEEFKNGQDEQALHNWMVYRRPGSVNGSVYVYDDTDFWRIFSGDFSYDKASWVLHMLRHVIGDDNFFDTLAAYRNAYEYGSAITDDFVAVAEGVWGDDLSWFFDLWIYDIGAPKYRSDWQQYDINGRTFVELYIKQTQSSSYPIFPMPIDIVTSVGSDDTVHVVWNDEDAEHLLFEVDGPIDDLEVDPEDWILATSNRSTTFIEGPPKIISIEPVENGKGNTVRIDVVFHKDVDIIESDLLFEGDQHGQIPFTLTYNQSTQTASLVPDDALPTDTYTLTVYDTVTDISSGQPLDGELDAFRWHTETTYPTGDGLSGGHTIMLFDAVFNGPSIGDEHEAIDPIDVQPWP